MKLNSLILMLSFTLLMGSACTRKVVVVKRTPAATMPPGQAKKVTGSQSAKAYAPGQQKKRN